MIKIKKQAHWQDKHKDATKQQVGKREILEEIFLVVFNEEIFFGILNINK